MIKMININFVKILLLNLFILAVSFIVSADQRNYGRSFELGYGFVEKHYTLKNSNDHWESLANYQTIFFKDRELGSLDGFKITPSNKFAIYLRSNTSNLYLFDIGEEKEIQLKFNGYCYPTRPIKEYLGVLSIGCLSKKDIFYNLKVNLSNYSTKCLKASNTDRSN